jgi:hypothetical protein
VQVPFEYRLNVTVPVGLSPLVTSQRERAATYDGLARSPACNWPPWTLRHPVDYDLTVSVRVLDDEPS